MFALGDRAASKDVGFGLPPRGKENDSFTQSFIERRKLVRKEETSIGIMISCLPASGVLCSSDLRKFAGNNAAARRVKSPQGTRTMAICNTEKMEFGLEKAD